MHSIIPKDNAIYIAIVIGDDLLKEVSNDIHLKQVLPPLSEKGPLSTYHLAPGNSLYKIMYPSIKTILMEYNSENLMKELIIKLEVCRFFYFTKQICT